jgi:predicted DNA binding CopG/RHH family protein
MKAQSKSIPEFKSVDEELEFWDTHSAVEFLDRDSVVDIDASKARENRDKRLTQQISLRFSHRILERTKSRAQMLGVPYQTLIQLWIAERLENEEALVRSMASPATERRVSGSRGKVSRLSDAKED